MQRDKDMSAQGRSPGKQWGLSKDRGQQGESLGEQRRKSDTDLRGEEKSVLRQPSVMGPCHWDSTGKANQSGSSSCVSSPALCVYERESESVCDRAATVSYYLSTIK